MCIFDISSKLNFLLLTVVNDLGLRRDRFHFSSCLRVTRVYINYGIRFFRVMVGVLDTIEGH